MTQPRDERNLHEVRAILQRLQRIASDPGEAGVERAGEAGLPEAETAADEGHGAGADREHAAYAAFERPPAPGSGARVGLALAVLAIIACGVAYLWFNGSAVVPPGATDANTPPRENASAQKPRASTLVVDAQELMAAGRIGAARDLLLKASGEPSMDVAFALARSYDPTVLNSIPAADAGADLAEAERWYRRWHELAVKDGVRMDAERLDRLIRAMRAARAGG